MGRHYDGAAGLPQKYKVSAKQPIDIREIVDTFDDLLDNRATFYNSAYKGMRVIVLDESCVYEMVADTFSKSPSDWKRLTIEIITTKEALQRAKNNLVNGALIYISKDIDKRDVLNFDGYFGEGTEVIVKNDLNTEGLPIGCFQGTSAGAGAMFCYYSPGESREYLIKYVSDWEYDDGIYIYENAEDGNRYLMVNGFLEPYEESDNSENIEQKAGLYFCEKGVLTMAGGGGEDIYTPNASDVTYDNTTSTLEAKNVQAAIDELNSDLEEKEETINSLLKGDLGVKSVTLMYGQNEDAITLALMRHNMKLSSIKVLGVDSVNISYGDTLHSEIYPEIPEQPVNMGDADFMVIKITRDAENADAVVGLKFNL